MPWDGKSGAKLLAGAVAGALVVGYIYRRWTKARKKFVQVGKVAKLYIYPVKSCGGMELNEIDAFEVALQYKKLKDRHWIVVDGKGHEVTHDSPKLVTITPSLHGDQLHLDAKDMETLRLPVEMSGSDDSDVIKTSVLGTEVNGADCGDTAAKWISTFLHKPGCRILAFLPEFQPRFSKDDTVVNVKKLCLDSDMIAYQGHAPVLLVVQESVDDFAGQVPNSKATALQYRPNIIVNDCKAYDEEKWSTYRIGQAVSGRVIFRAFRCAFICVDPETGHIDPKITVLKKLEKYRPAFGSEKAIYGNKGIMGVFLTVDELGSIKVGDAVFATYK